MTSAGSDLALPAVRRSDWRGWHTLVSALIVLAIIALAIWATTSSTLITDLDGRLPVWIFLALIAMFAAFILLIGWAITGRPGGALIDPKKARFSLSRLQMIAWTILILAAYLNAFIVNIAAGRDNPIDVAIPGQLLVAMGISITGLIGTQIVLGYKQTTNGAGYQTTDGNKIVVLRDDQPATDTDSDTATRGAIYKPPTTQLTDIFRGDTIEGANSLDLGKVQLFYITVILVLGYGIFTATGFAHLTTGHDGGIATLPKINQAFVALLALSQGGYLTTKATS